MDGITAQDDSSKDSNVLIDSDKSKLILMGIFDGFGKDVSEVFE
jgi:hypothetical protein